MKTRAAGVLVVAWLAGGGQAYAQESAGSVAAGNTWLAEGSAPQSKIAAQASRPSAAPREPGRAGAFDLSVSVLWLAPSSLGSAAANLIANDTRASAYRLFDASGDFDHAVGLEGRLGYQITRAFAVEGGLTYSRPGITVTVANDVEGAAGFTATGETISQFFLDASLVVYPIPRGSQGGRLRPFLEVGVGYLRELHGQTGAVSGFASVETGQVYHVGGGARYFFSTRRTGFVKAYGLRFDGRFYFRDGGFSFDGKSVNSFAAGAGLVIAF